MLWNAVKDPEQIFELFENEGFGRFTRMLNPIRIEALIWEEAKPKRAGGTRQTPFVKIMENARPNEKK